MNIEYNNRFDLIHLAARRARRLSTHNVQPLVEWGNDNAIVVALREIHVGYKFDEFGNSIL
jgi:DNA-directed RNA polymerase omega subunit